MFLRQNETRYNCRMGNISVSTEFRLFLQNALQQNPAARSVDLLRAAQAIGYCGSPSHFRKLVRSYRPARTFECRMCKQVLVQPVQKGRSKAFCSDACRTLYWNNQQKERPTAKGLCRWCPTPIETGRKLCEPCRVLKNTKSKVWASETRNLVITHYGGKCACSGCHEIRQEFLAVDHVNGGGNKHRKEIGMTNANSFCRWLIKNDFPAGFRVLCHNCNCARGYYGYCPHEKEN